ncbi:vacuolar fusion protein MON1 homolog isoform X2 [Vigna angularis]|uniref:vacuolar fusion protein MON1 homolog isoform X2 n=1 Tax=Phaseolus angularis TaxID=3914 RepID=UPI0022B5194E|nr:vacuolar fusion protein MON1 homolog isoform X2 [Vigna angularis]
MSSPTDTHSLSKIITMNDNETESDGEIRASVEPASEEAPSSPGSSGYVGEGGSTSATTGSQFEIEHEEIEEDTTIHMDRISISDSHASWIPGKRHFDEDDGSISWRKRKKHFFVLSHSGKPIYSRGDSVKLVRAGRHQVIFLVKGPIYLVCISSTEEPYASLRGQLELIYGQMLVILTKSINRCFEKNPKFDMTPLLGGTEIVFSSLIHSFSWNPATFLHAYTCLPLAYATRQAAGAILQDVADSGVLFAILMCRHKVISLVGAQKASLHPDDILLLANFVMASESFRTSESFSPICLPRYNPSAFLYSYIHYFDADTYLVLLSTNSDAFYHLKDCRIRVENVLLKSCVLSEVQRSLLNGGMHVEDLPPISHSGSSHLGQHMLPSDSPDRFREANSGIGGPAGLWHFIYRSIYLDQYVSSEFPPSINTPQLQKRLYRAYEKLFASMHDKGIGPHKTQFRRDENYVLLCWVTQDFELYAAFDPLADKALAIKTCNHVCQWIKDVENEIFLLGASPFSW